MSNHLSQKFGSFFSILVLVFIIQWMPAKPQSVDTKYAPTITGSIPYTLNVNKNVSSGGKVTSSPGGITCGSVCSHVFASNTLVTLKATANTGYNFLSWSGGLTGTTNPASLTMNTNKNVTANFIQIPQNVSATDGTNTNMVQLTWNASAGATSYKVFRATSAGGTKILQGSTTGTSFADTTALPGVTYYYWVKAYWGASFSAFSASNTGWRKLSPPNNLNASDGTYTAKVQLTWNASAGATSYKVYRASSAGGVKALLGIRTVTSFADNTAINGVTYYYWVKAYRGTRFSTFSSYNTGWRHP